jgi:peptidoglycan/LPS O-acetylase OafA/YrhL
MHSATHAIPLIAPQTEIASPHKKSTDRITEAASTRSHNDSSVWSFGSHCVELDGVRGLAILLVTLYRFMKEWDPSMHWGLALGKKYCDFGERGVDLFFVLSGFLITGILLQTKSSPGYFKNFIVRRALRIFPLYFTAILICLFLLPNLMTTDVFDLPRSNQAYLWTYTSNIYMAWTNSWCFGPLDHFWSLAVEEHFYLVWPAVVFCLSSKALLRLTFVMVAVVGVARTAFALRPEFGLAVDALTLFRCDALALGAMLAVVMKNGLTAESVNRFAKWVLPVLALAGLIVVLSGKRWMGMPHTLFGCLWLVVMAIVVTRTRSDRLSRCLRAPSLQWLGKYSYGMYVIQLPLVTLLPMATVVSWLGWDALHPLVGGCAYVTILLGMTCALAFVSYHCLEKPFLNLKRWFA